MAQVLHGPACAPACPRARTACMDDCMRTGPISPTWWQACTAQGLCAACVCLLPSHTHAHGLAHPSHTTHAMPTLNNITHAGVAGRPRAECQGGPGCPLRPRPPAPLLPQVSWVGWWGGGVDTWVDVCGRCTQQLRLAAHSWSRQHHHLLRSPPSPSLLPRAAQNRPHPLPDHLPPSPFHSGAHPPCAA